MTQKLPLPITAAMLATANAANEGKPRYLGAGVAGDWAGGASGNDINASTANVAIASGAANSAADSVNYTPRTQVAKGQNMSPSKVIAYDIGSDYGVYSGQEGRAGTIAPRTPYPDSTSPPVVTGVSPNTGPAAGGTAVTISGINLTGATAVTFGGTAATAITVVNSYTITATAPAKAASTVDVVVTTPRGASPTGGSGDNFIYT